MPGSTRFDIRHLGPHDVTLLQAMSALFGEAFGETRTYTAAGPSRGYLVRLLASDSFIALAAL